MVNNKKILIAYASGTGSTEKLAQLIAEGIRKVDGVSIDLKRAKDVKQEYAVSADGYAFGTYSASMYLEEELKDFFEELYPVKDKLSGKPILIFATGQGGQVAALASLDRIVDTFNPRWIKPGLAVKGMPGEADRSKAIEMGEKLADAVKKTKSSYIIA